MQIFIKLAHHCTSCRVGFGQNHTAIVKKAFKELQMLLLLHFVDDGNGCDSQLGWQVPPWVTLQLAEGGGHECLVSVSVWQFVSVAGKSNFKSQPSQSFWSDLDFAFWSGWCQLKWIRMFKPLDKSQYGLKVLALFVLEPGIPGNEMRYTWGPVSFAHWRRLELEWCSSRKGNLKI